jgi:hypothetical protein
MVMVTVESYVQTNPVLAENFPGERVGGWETFAYAHDQRACLQPALCTQELHMRAAAYSHREHLVGLRI